MAGTGCKLLELAGMTETALSCWKFLNLAVNG